MIKQLLHAELLQSIEKYGVIEGIQKWEDMVDELKLEVLDDLLDYDINKLLDKLNPKSDRP